jgi:hypothetical protein
MFHIENDEPFSSRDLDLAEVMLGGATDRDDA